MTTQTPEEQFAKDVNSILVQVTQMLVAKNRKYGDAALNPKQTFSKASPEELINIRIDDKLSRIANKQTDEDEDPEWDLLGYLVLKRILKLRQERTPKEPTMAELLGVTHRHIEPSRPFEEVPFNSAPPANCRSDKGHP